MKEKKSYKQGFILVLIGVFFIFTSAVFNAGKTFSELAYIYDVFSTIGVIIVPIGVAMVIKGIR